jgi:hypothetical protein
MYYIVLIDNETLRFSNYYKVFEECLKEYDAYNRLNKNIKLYLVETKRRYYKIIKSNV